MLPGDGWTESGCRAAAVVLPATRELRLFLVNLGNDRKSTSHLLPRTDRPGGCLCFLVCYQELLKLGFSIISLHIIAQHVFRVE